MPPSQRTPSTGTNPHPDLVCTYCLHHANPLSVAWSQADAILLHTRRIQFAPGHLPSICGGRITPTNPTRIDLLRPGDLTLAWPMNTQTLDAHEVRLGRPTGPRRKSWTGTATCGRQFSGSRGRWRPVPPDVEASLCAECAARRHGRRRP